MRSRLYGRLGTAAAVVLVLLAADAGRAQAQAVPAAPGTGAVTFRVTLPTADAQLWMAGMRKPGSGTSRTLSVSNLPLGQRYTYVFKAVWSRDGRIIVSDTRNVGCRPGEEVVIDFRQPNPRGTLVEVVPDELPVRSAAP